MNSCRGRTTEFAPPLIPLLRRGRLLKRRRAWRLQRDFLGTHSDALPAHRIDLGNRPALLWLAGQRVDLIESVVQNGHSGRIQFSVGRSALDLSILWTASARGFET